MTITEFLLARIAEDEVEIGPGEDYDIPPNGIGWGEVGAISEVLMVSQQRARAECQAKRAIVADALDVVDPEPGEDPYAEIDTLDDGQVWAFSAALHHLAAVYADHPDYDETWRP
ncbi:MAG TPA: DUF6221 family protein [Rariglobus sp.]